MKYELNINRYLGQWFMYIVPLLYTIFMYSNNIHTGI